MSLLSVLSLVASGCYEQAFVPGDEAGDRITITNDEFELEQRVEYSERVIPIDPALTLSSTIPASASVRSGPALAPSSIDLTLIAEAGSPVINGQTVQAVAVEQITGTRAIVSYSTPGIAGIGAMDLFQISGQGTPTLRSSASFMEADVIAVALDNLYAYAAQASTDETRPAAAVLERFIVEGNKMTLDGLVEAQLGSFVATSAVSTGSVVYETSGNTGSVYALNPSDLTVLAEYTLDGARWVTLDEVNGWVVVLQGEPGRIAVFEEGNFSGGSLNLLAAWSVPGVDAAEAKSTLEVHGSKVFVAAGPDGLQVICLDNGQVVGSVPRPDPSELSLDPSVVVTNAVTVDDDLLFISNGEAGVYVAAVETPLDQTACTDTQAISVLGRLRFDDLQSANHVTFRGDQLWVAAGRGGIKIVDVDLRR